MPRKRASQCCNCCWWWRFTRVTKYVRSELLVSGKGNGIFPNSACRAEASRRARFPRLACSALQPGTEGLKSPGRLIPCSANSEQNV
eukprot:3314589-Rhodomonas_salina.1